MSHRAAHIVQGNALEIHIATKKQRRFLLLLICWTVIASGWSCNAVLFLFREDIVRFLGCPAALAFWAPVPLLAYAWIWNTFGKEIVKVEADLLAVKRDVWGWGPTKTFQVHKISNLHAARFFVSNYWTASWGLSGGTVAFDYEGKTHRFGIQLEEQEANKVVEALKRYLPEAASASNTT